MYSIRIFSLFMFFAVTLLRLVYILHYGFCKKGSLQLRLSFSFIMTEIFVGVLLNSRITGLIKYVIAELLLLKD